MFFEILSVVCLLFIIILLSLFIVEKKKAIKRFNEFLKKNDEIQDMINKNQSEIKESIKSHTGETNNEFQKTNIKMAESQEKLEKRISENKETIENKMLADFVTVKEQISLQYSIIEKIIKDHEQLRKKLEFFTEIGSDSKQLNEVEDPVEQESMLEKASSEIDRLSTINISEDNSSQQPLTEIKETAIDIESFESSKSDSILDSDQMRAYSAMENTNDNFFITGKAGTGKSFLLSLFENRTTKSTLKVAPTGIAALNVNGSTIHSTFGFYNLVDLDVEDINIKTIKLKSEKKMVLKFVNTIIIDEISMVRADTFDKIDRILRAINDNDKLFGGKQILVFGDLFQLPPIANKEEEEFLKNRYGGIFFFFSNAYKEGDFNFIELETNHRQKNDDKFFEILNRIRVNLISEDDISVINHRVSTNSDDLRRVVRLYPTKGEAERVNKDELNKIPAREYSYEVRILFNKYGNQNINIESNFPITSTLKLKLGALVMMVNNHENKLWVNGTLGIVSFISEDLLKVKINDIECEVHKCTFESREAKYSNERISYEVTLEIEQYPIVLAYALTIHKSQGMTYKRVACDITNCFAPGQAYVALSRCSSLGGIYLLKPISSSDINVSTDVKNFYIDSKKF